MGDGKGGGNGVDGEDQICRFDQDHNQEQGSKHPFVINRNEELGAHLVFCNGKVFAAQTKDRVLFGIDLFFAVFEVDLDSGVDQENAESIQDPMEPRNEISPDKNENAPE